MKEEEAASKQNRVYRNIGIFDLLKYHLPWAGKLSILHRLSGLFIFLCLGCLINFFQKSVVSEQSYQLLMQGYGGYLVKGLFFLLSWAFVHHFFAGIRYLLLDLHIGVSREASQRSAVWVFVLTVLALIAIWW